MKVIPAAFTNIGNFDSVFISLKYQIALNFVALFNKKYIL